MILYPIFLFILLGDCYFLNEHQLRHLGDYNSMVDVSKREVACPIEKIKCSKQLDYEETRKFECHDDSECSPSYKCCEDNCFRHKLCTAITNTDSKEQDICPVEKYSCSTPVDYEQSKRFWCSDIDPCPSNYKCCYDSCFHHKICKEAEKITPGSTNFPISTTTTQVTSATPSVTKSTTVVTTIGTTTEVVTTSEEHGSESTTQITTIPSSESSDKIEISTVDPTICVGRVNSVYMCNFNYECPPCHRCYEDKYFAYKICKRINNAPTTNTPTTTAAVTCNTAILTESATKVTTTPSDISSTIDKLTRATISTTTEAEIDIEPETLGNETTRTASTTSDIPTTADRTNAEVTTAEEFTSTTTTETSDKITELPSTTVTISIDPEPEPQIIVVIDDVTKNVIPDVTITTVPKIIDGDTTTIFLKPVGKETTSTGSVIATTASSFPITNAPSIISSTTVPRTTATTIVPTTKVAIITVTSPTIVVPTITAASTNPTIVINSTVAGSNITTSTSTIAPKEQSPSELPERGSGDNGSGDDQEGGDDDYVYEDITDTDTGTTTVLPTITGNNSNSSLSNKEREVNIAIKKIDVDNPKERGKMTTKETINQYGDDYVIVDGIDGPESGDNGSGDDQEGGDDDYVYGEITDTDTGTTTVLPTITGNNSNSSLSNKEREINIATKKIDVDNPKERGKMTTKETINQYGDDYVIVDGIDGPEPVEPEKVYINKEVADQVGTIKENNGDYFMLNDYDKKEEVSGSSNKSNDENTTVKENRNLVFGGDSKQERFES